MGLHVLAEPCVRQMFSNCPRDARGPGLASELRYVRYADDFVLGFIGRRAGRGRWQVKEWLGIRSSGTTHSSCCSIQGKDSHGRWLRATRPSSSAMNSSPAGQPPSSTHREWEAVNDRLDYGFPPKSSNRSSAYMRNGKPAHRTGYAMRTPTSWTVTELSSGPSFSTTHWPTTSRTSGNCPVMERSIDQDSLVITGDAAVLRKDAGATRAWPYLGLGERHCLTGPQGTAEGEWDEPTGGGAVRRLKKRQAVHVDQQPRYRFNRNELIQKAPRGKCELFFQR